MQKHASKIKWGSLAVAVIAVLLMMRTLPMGQFSEQLGAWLEGLGVWGPLIFGLIYVLATVLLIPGWMLTVAAGAAFGLLVGFIAVSLASTTGAALAFLIARYAARSRVEQMAKSRPKFDAVDRAISEGGWKVVAMLRLSPAIPFNVQNYLYGLTDLKFWPYVLTSWLAMIPGTFMYVYIGHVAGMAATEGDRERTAGEWALLIAGLLATVAVTVYITRLAKQKLQEQTDIQEAESAQAEEAPADDQAAKSQTSPAAAGVYAAIALVLLGVAIFAQFKSDAIAQTIRQWVGAGPPAVTMQEAYAEKPQGPSFDHSTFDEVLSTYVREGGWVDYEGLRQNPEKLDDYITQVGDAPFDELGRDEKLALLINAYNAFTLKLIIENHPVDSIKDIPPAERWEAERWQVGSHTWSLNQIEHEQIRPHFAEPRVHFVLVCAAVGCPPLTREAYTADRIDQQLERQAEYVHNHETWFRFSEGDETVELTPLYDWYAGDFEQAAGSMLEYAAQYSPPLQRRLETGAPPGKRFLEYDWALNDVSNRQPR